MNEWTVMKNTTRTPFSSVRMDKISARIIAQIRQNILKGRLRPGDRLASEQEMIEQFNVSRQTLREAVTVMEYMGLLERRAGVKGGIYVREIDETHVRECLFDFLAFKNFKLEHIFEVRVLLETYALRIFMERQDNRLTEKMHEINAVMAEAIEKSDYLEADACAMAFHRIIVEATDNPVLIFLGNCVEDLLNTAKDTLILDKAYCTSVLEEHEHIALAVENHALSDVQALLTADLDHVKLGLEELSKRSLFQQRMEMESYRRKQYQHA